MGKVFQFDLAIIRPASLYAAASAAGKSFDQKAARSLFVIHDLGFH